MTIAENIVGILCGLVIIGEIIWIGIALHIGYTKMDLMLAHLSNSSSIVNIAPLRHGGPWGMLLLVGGISGVLTFPNTYLKHGMINAEDIKKFPIPLKKKLALLQWNVITLICSMTFLVLLYKSGVLKHL